MEALPTLKERFRRARRRLAADAAGSEVEICVVHRIAGLGSLGRLRFVALADWHGGSVAREAKELTTSAWLWANPSRKLSGQDFLSGYFDAVAAMSGSIREIVWTMDAAASQLQTARALSWHLYRRRMTR